MKTLRQKLAAMQSTLKASKNEYNSFGRYKYRSAEGILEAVKPLLKERELVLTLHDEVNCIGNFNYVKATASLSDLEGNVIQTSAYAREDETLKGMCAGQITGACSSYARKYALCGLFAIDGSDDLDKVNDNRSDKPSSPADDNGGKTDVGTSYDRNSKIKSIIGEIDRIQTTEGLLHKWNQLKGWTKETEISQAFSRRRSEIEQRQNKPPYEDEPF